MKTLINKQSNNAKRRTIFELLTKIYKQKKFLFTLARVLESCVIVLLKEMYLKSLIHAMKIRIAMTLMFATELKNNLTTYFSYNEYFYHALGNRCNEPSNQSLTQIPEE
jgi:hypothetical protein